MLENTPNLDFYQDHGKTNRFRRNNKRGVVTGLGHHINAKSVVLTNGTFLNGIIHIGEKSSEGGRMAEKASAGITEQLVEWGFESNRLKTGTPPRIDGRSLIIPKWKNKKEMNEITGFLFRYSKKTEAKKLLDYLYQ